MKMLIIFSIYTLIMKGAEHHLQTRKFLYKNLTQYPHPDFWKRFIDIVVFLVGGIGPFFTLPQVLSVWFSKNAEGLSPITWVSYFIFSCVWLMYGIIHKEKPIIFSNAIYVIINALIVVGIIIF